MQRYRKEQRVFIVEDYFKNYTFWKSPSNNCLGIFWTQYIPESHHSWPKLESLITIQNFFKLNQKIVRLDSNIFLVLFYFKF